MSERFRIGICEWGLPFTDIDELFTFIKSVDMEAVQVEINKDLDNCRLLKNNGYKKYIEASKKYDIDITSISLTALDYISMVLPETSEEGKEARKCIHDSIEIASKMGIPMIMVPSFGRSNIANKEDLDMAVEVLKKACEHAKDLNIIVASESLLETDELDYLFEKVNMPNLKLYFDSQNHYLHKKINMVEFYNQNVDRTIEIHLKDGKDGELSARSLGEGSTGFEATCQAINKSSYKGYLIIENYYNKPPLSEQGELLELVTKDVNTIKSMFNI